MSVKKIIIKSVVDGNSVSKTFNAVDSSTTLAKAITLGKAYVALTSGVGQTATLQEITETSGSINEDA